MDLCAVYLALGVECHAVEERIARLACLEERVERLSAARSPGRAAVCAAERSRIIFRAANGADLRTLLIFRLLLRLGLGSVTGSLGLPDIALGVARCIDAFAPLVPARAVLRCAADRADDYIVIVIEVPAAGRAFLTV